MIPEWGAIDLIEEVEATFGLTIADEDAERCVTVGDLYALICAHAPEWDGLKGKCDSAMVFNRLRRSLAPCDRRGFRPDMKLETIGLPPSGLFRKLEQDTDLRLPKLKATWLGPVGGLLVYGGPIAAIVFLLDRQWVPGGGSLLSAVAGLLLLRVDRGRLPAGISTVADLVRRTTALNADMLRQSAARSAYRWAILTALAAEHGRHAPDEIGPETFLIAGAWSWRSSADRASLRTGDRPGVVADPRPRRKG